MALPNFVIHVGPRRCLSPNQHDGDRDSVQLVVDPFFNRVFALLLDFFPRSSIPKSSTLAVLCDPTISHLARSPHVPLIVEAKEHPSRHDPSIQGLNNISITMTMVPNTTP